MSDVRRAESSGWTVRTFDGTVRQAHGRPHDILGRSVVRVRPTDRAIVLASTQSVAALDHDAVAAAGLSVVRRRSGGGAVLVEPGGIVWLDVDLPRDDPLWVDDVGRSSSWLATRCARALTSMGVADVAVVDRMAPTAWSALVCFAGSAPGEVTAGGRKVVGVAQRRTRAGARFQLSALLRWDPIRVASLFELDEDARGELVGVLATGAGGLDRGYDEVEAALVSAVTTP